MGRGAAWVSAVAPWAGRVSPTQVTAVPGPQVALSAEDVRLHGLSRPMAFDLAGLTAEWRDDLFVVFAERPAGVERVVVESWSGEGTLDALNDVLVDRLKDAREATISSIDTSKWVDSDVFRWLAIGGEQHPARALQWQRGLHTSAVLAGDVLVSVTAPEADPSRNERLRGFLRSFRFGAAAAREHVRCVVRVEEREVPLDDDRRCYAIGSGPQHDIVISGADDHHADLVRDGAQWRLVPTAATRERVTVNGERVPEAGRPLIDEEVIRLHGGDVTVALTFLDEVFKRAPIVSGPVGSSSVLIPPPEATAVSTTHLPAPLIAVERTSLSAPGSLRGLDDIVFSLKLYDPVERKYVVSHGSKVLRLFVPGGGHVDIRGCRDMSPLHLCLNVELQRIGYKMKRRFSLRNPNLDAALHGQPCKLRVGRVYAAVAIEKAWQHRCVGVICPRAGEAAFIEISEGRVGRDGVFRATDDALDAMLRSWRWAP